MTGAAAPTSRGSTRIIQGRQAAGLRGSLRAHEPRIDADYNAAMRTLVVAAALGALIAEAAPARISVTSAARRVQPGEVVVLTVRATAPVEALKARAFNRDLTPFRVDASKWRVLVGIDLAVKPGKHEVTIVTGSDDAPVRFPLVVTRRAFGVAEAEPSIRRS